MKPLSKSKCERGSALLIVFVFAATIAIMLYMEMPVAVFEAQRNKEQLLIDRGNEYSHGIKLYLRKVGQYPPSFDALENTNRMRFLRKRFKDPFTGKDDWRLLHAGPNGMLTDSKVKPINNNVAGTNNTGTNSNNTGAGNSTTSTFGGFNGSSGFGSSASNSSNSTFGGFNTSTSNATGAAEVVVPSIPQRAPAIAANGANAQEANNPTNAEAPVSTASNLQANVLQTTANGQPLGPGPSTSPGAPSTQTGTDRAFTANQNPMTPQAGGTNPTNAGPGGSPPFRLSPSGTSSSGMGVLQSGGLAGVASKADGHSIKTVNDQENYSLWEFYYDPTKDAMRNAAGALSQMGGTRGIGQSSPNSTSGTNPSSPSSGFGNFGSGLSGMQNQSNGSNGFSQGRQNTNSPFGNSGFGNSNTSGGPPPTTSTTVPTTGPPQ